MAADPPPTRLARKLGVGDAVFIGLGSMLGAGVFSALAPAAAAAGNALLAALLVAAAVAFCNATSSAQLAARHPEAGGTYAYGRHRLGPGWGFAAGWSFVAGKLASATAMALTFGYYVFPAAPRAAAAAVALLLTVVNLLGVKKTATTTRAIVVIVVLTLGLVVVVAAPNAETVRLWPVHAPSARGVLRAAAFLFFAFAGYARIATLGEEVIDPARTIPRAIPIALALALLVYAAVAAAVLAAVPLASLAQSPAPLVTAVATSHPDLSWVPRVGAAIATAGVLLSLLAGMSRTVFAMASQGDLPRALAAVHPRFQVPHRAELLLGCTVAALALILPLVTAIGWSSCLVLTYYAVTNAAALRLRPDERRWPRLLAVGGLAGCALIAASLPLPTVLLGGAVIAAGVLGRRLLQGSPASGANS